MIGSILQVALRPLSFAGLILLLPGMAGLGGFILSQRMVYGINSPYGSVLATGGGVSISGLDGCLANMALRSVEYRRVLGVALFPFKLLCAWISFGSSVVAPVWKLGLDCGSVCRARETMQEC